MKDHRKKLVAIAALTISTTAAIHALNRFIEKTAIAKNLMNKGKNSTFQWRFGDVNYTKNGSGSPVLLIHELTPCSNSHEWHRIVNSLSEKYTVYSLDLPGCGLSDKQNITYTNFYYVQLITDFAKSVIGSPVSVLATGLSASLAVTSCNYDPQLFRKLILVNPSDLRTLSQIPTRKSKAAKALLELPLVGTLLYHMIVSRSRVEREFTERLLADPFQATATDIDIYHESAHRACSRGKYLLSSIIGNYVYFNIGHALKSIDNDIIIIGGESQEGIAETAAAYKAINPAIESVIIPNTRHLPQMEDPGAFLEQLRIYL